MDQFAISRDKLIEQLRGLGISDERVLEAMRAVKRHLFVPEALWAQAYKNMALPISSGQTISQPWIVAKMTELIDPQPTDKVLEIGAGSGYQSAVLAALVKSVYAIERVPQLAGEHAARIKAFGLLNVRSKCGDGTVGWKDLAPFDSILIAAGGPEIPQPLVQQLKIGGKLVMPLAVSDTRQILIRVTRTQTAFRREDHGDCTFVPLIGAHGFK